MTFNDPQSWFQGHAIWRQISQKRYKNYNEIGLGTK